MLRMSSLSLTSQKKQVNKNKLWFVLQNFPVKDPSIQKPVKRLASKIK